MPVTLLIVLALLLSPSPSPLHGALPGVLAAPAVTTLTAETSLGFTLSLGLPAAPTHPSHAGPTVITTLARPAVADAVRLGANSTCYAFGLRLVQQSVVVGTAAAPCAGSPGPSATHAVAAFALTVTATCVGSLAPNHGRDPAAALLSAVAGWLLRNGTASDTPPPASTATTAGALPWYRDVLWAASHAAGSHYADAAAVQLTVCNGSGHGGLTTVTEAPRCSGRCEATAQLLVWAGAVLLVVGALVTAVAAGLALFKGKQAARDHRDVQWAKRKWAARPAAATLGFHDVRHMKAAAAALANRCAPPSHPFETPAEAPAFHVQVQAEDGGEVCLTLDTEEWDCASERRTFSLGAHPSLFSRTPSRANPLAPPTTSPLAASEISLSTHSHRSRGNRRIPGAGPVVVAASRRVVHFAEETPQGDSDSSLGSLGSATRLHR